MGIILVLFIYHLPHIYETVRGSPGVRRLVACVEYIICHILYGGGVLDQRENDGDEPGGAASRCLENSKAEEEDELLSRLAIKPKEVDSILTKYQADFANG